MQDAATAKSLTLEGSAACAGKQAPHTHPSFHVAAVLRLSNQEKFEVKVFGKELHNKSLFSRAKSGRGVIITPRATVSKKSEMCAISPKMPLRS